MNKKTELRFKNLREAMAAIQEEREEEVGRHTWRDVVKHYGEAILFAEMATIMSRLQVLIWEQNPYENPDNPEMIERTLDLCIDLGNFTEFLYLATLDREKRASAQAARDEEVS